MSSCSMFLTAFHLLNLMTEDFKRVIPSCLQEDRISNLPEHLIDSILERLPVKEAVRTSIISKSWRYKWTTMTSLAFNEDFSDEIAKNGAFGRNGFIRIINHVLFLHKGPILKFHIHIPDNIILDSFQEVDQWMLYVSRNGITELLLINANGRYEIPCYVFSCLELTKLLLEDCLFKPPLGFEGFLYLEDLEFVAIDFGASSCGTKINLPQLKVLSLNKCTNVYNFNIKATKLQSLTVWACPDAMLLQLLDSPCLLKFWIAPGKPIEDFVRVEKMNLATMLISNLPIVEDFYIDNHFLKFLTAEKIPKLLPREISSLKHLHLVYYQLGDLDQLHGALCLLRNSPNLETLFMLPIKGPQDVGPALKHLESPNCLDCTLYQLQKVEMTCLEGSRLELLFIKLLLAYSPSLEKFTITSCGHVEKRHNIAKDLLWFPRASPKAKIIYNHEP